MAVGLGGGGAGGQDPGGGTAPQPQPAPRGILERIGGWKWMRLKIVIPLMIAVVSVTGALVTWKAASLEARAGGADGRAVVEKTIQARSEVQAEQRLVAERAGFTRYVLDMTWADRLDVEAAAAGGTAGAQLADSARVTRTIATERARLEFDATYVKADGGARTYDVERRRTDLRVFFASDLALAVNPDETGKVADDLRRRSEQLVGILVVLVLAVLVLTVGQVSRRPSWRRSLALVGGSIWVTVSIAAVTVAG